MAKADSVNWGRLAVYLTLLVFCCIWWVGAVTCFRWIVDWLRS